MSGAGLQEEGQIAVFGLTEIYKEVFVYIATHPSNIEEVEVEFVMTRQREEGDTKGRDYYSEVIPKDEFKELVEFQKKRCAMGSTRQAPKKHKQRLKQS